MHTLEIEQRNSKLVRRQLLEMAATTFALIYLAACHYIPDWLNRSDKPTRNPKCKMDMLFWNDIYAVCFLLPPLVANLIFVASYRWQLFWGRHPVVIYEWIKKTLTIMLIAAALMTLIGYTTWFFFAVKKWKLKTIECS
jgi:antibiotic biosynthesis monooxygenase (ABM) superfamily enzyme